MIKQLDKGKKEEIDKMFDLNNVDIDPYPITGKKDDAWNFGIS